MDFGRELGRISRFREHSHFAAICDYMEARAEAGDHDAVKRCLKTTSGHPVVVAELFGPVTTDPYDDDYYIGSPTKDNDTAEMEASYQGLLWLWNNDTHVPAVIISDSERALTAMDGHRAVVGSGAAELYCGPSGGVNVVLANHLHKMFKQEAQRRNGGLDVGHVKGHSGDPLNDRADMLAVFCTTRVEYRYTLCK